MGNQHSAIVEQATNFPVIHSLVDVNTKYDEIVAFVKKNPTLDKVYPFESVLRNKTPNVDASVSAVVAGSAALKVVAETLSKKRVANINDQNSSPPFNDHKSASNAESKHHEEAVNVAPAWKPSDTDVFFLRCAETSRRKVGDVDLVHVLEESVEELLLSFDLPCCRVATDSTGRWWMSLHCMHALLTGKFPLPSYLQDEQAFFQVCDSVESKESSHDSAPLDANDAKNDSGRQAYMHICFQRLADRLVKYGKRGFHPTWFETDVILPWVKKRTAYHVV